MMRIVGLAIVVAAAMNVSAAQTPPQSTPPTAPPPRSPEVAADRRATFRLRAPRAEEVLVAREGAPRLPMAKDADGVWSVTTEPLEPDVYGYSFIVDGVRVLDPVNGSIKPNRQNPASLLHVAGAGLPWEIADVPHGVVHRHQYRSRVAGDERDFFVYTPPGYDAGSRGLPVLYLLHGMSDGAEAWSSEVGRANVILDNLISGGRAKPMVVVMPLGYGAPEILEVRWRGGPADAALGGRNRELFAKALLTEIVPAVERDYRVAADRGSRAIAGLSMGGTESLVTALNALDRFAWVGAFSSGGLPGDLPATFPSLDGARANQSLRLLWIACGTDDPLIAANRQLRSWLTSKGVRHTAIETPGAHTWMVWRRNLAAFAPLLFQDAPSSSAR
jgi:enterochelin esterase family protein